MKEKFNAPRRTVISSAVGEFRIEELIPDEQVVVTISHKGYIKRVDIENFRRQGRGGRGVRGSDTREGDFIESLFVTSTHDYLLFFTSRGRVYWARVFDLPSGSRTARGRAIANLLRFQSNESCRAVLPVKEFEEAFVFFATANGTVKKTPMAAFSNPRPSGIIAIGLDADDHLVNVLQTGGGDDIVLGTRGGMAVRFHESDVRAMGRTARGVRGIKLRREDVVVDVVATQAGASLLTVCENGFGKRTGIEEYRLARRGGQGVINIKVTERNGRVVALKSVSDEDELMIITANGIMLRTGLEKIREIGRATQGVKLIRVDEGDKVVAVARIASEPETGVLPDAEDSAEPPVDGASDPGPAPGAEPPNEPSVDADTGDAADPPGRS
jgi:DNA gyrase subunit A